MPTIGSMASGATVSRMRLGVVRSGFWLAMLAGPSACADAVLLDPLPEIECRCDATGCPKDVCGLQVEVLAASCAKENVQTVELLLGTDLEPQPFHTGQPRRACVSLPRGTVRKMHARADAGWQWIEDVKCPAATPEETRGPMLSLPLNCSTGAQP